MRVIYVDRLDGRIVNVFDVPATEPYPEEQIPPDGAEYAGYIEDGHIYAVVKALVAVENHYNTYEVVRFA